MSFIWRERPPQTTTRHGPTPRDRESQHNLSKTSKFAFSHGLELFGRLISLGQIGMIVKQVNLEYVVNVFGIYLSQIHVVIDAVEALFSVFHEFLNHIKKYFSYICLFHIKGKTHSFIYIRFPLFSY